LKKITKGGKGAPALAGQPKKGGEGKPEKRRKGAKRGDRFVIEGTGEKNVGAAM